MVFKYERKKRDTLIPHQKKEEGTFLPAVEKAWT